MFIQYKILLLCGNIEKKERRKERFSAEMS